MSENLTFGFTHTKHRQGERTAKEEQIKTRGSEARLSKEHKICSNAGKHHPLEFRDFTSTPESRQIRPSGTCTVAPPTHFTLQHTGPIYIPYDLFAAAQRLGQPPSFPQNPKFLSLYTESEAQVIQHEQNRPRPRYPTRMVNIYPSSSSGTCRVWERRLGDSQILH